MAQDHNDIYSIVERLAILEGRITPTSVRHGLNPQQKSVPQLPALFKPKHISVLTAKKDPEHPMKGYAVGSSESQEFDEDEEMVEDAGLTWDGVDPTTCMFANEDVLEKATKSFTDYIKSVADEIKKDSDLKDKKHEDTDLKKKEKRDRDLIAKELKEHGTNLPEGKPCKTVTNECGIWEMHGDDHSGFEIRHGNRKLPTRFKNLEEAEIALEMFMNRRKQADDAQDYIDEA